MSAAKMTIAAALNHALHHAMAADDQIICIGEDIVGGAGIEGASPGGGVFGLTRGLAETYGLNRVIDTPISETAFVGMAVGSAMTGLRPVVEIMFNDFIGVCFDQILNQAAKARFLSNGRMDLPLVIRTTMGAGDGSGAMHSASLHGLLASVAGLTVVCPSTPADAAGMLKTALKSSGPTVIMEHKQLYEIEGDVDSSLPSVPFGKARTVIDGSDVTIVAVAAMAIEAELAAGLLAQNSIFAEVVDPRTIKPLDVASIATSVRKTGRLLVVDEGAAFAGFADALVAAVSEQAFVWLKAAPRKLCPPDTPVPYAPGAENIWLPDSADIVKAVQDMMGAYVSEKDPVKTVKVWDVGIRLFHWALAILFCLSAYSAFQDKFGIYADMHLNAGIATLMLVIWRIVWGVVGSDTARFSHFLKSPAAGFAHLKQMVAGLPYKAIGHNPLGGLSVVLMLILLLVQAGMGLFASDGMIFSGPLSAEVTGSLASDLTEWHALLGRILIGVVVFHVLVVLVYGVFIRVNLVWPMISGNISGEPSVSAPTMKPSWLALLLFIVVGATVCLSIF